MSSIKKLKSSSDDDSANDADTYVVVTTTYPTTYGCNRGKSWTQAELIARSDISATGSYKTRDEAIQAARRIRNRSCYFEDACEPDPDEYDSEDLEEMEDNDYRFTNSDEPPYDSADLENWDNDEEEMIEVMTREDFEEEQANNQAFLRKEGMKRRYHFTVKGKMMELQIKDAGRVHYSTPPQPFDLKAEVEVAEEDCRDGPLAKLMRADDLNRGLAVPSNASDIKSLMYLGGKKELKEFSTKCSRANKDEIAKGLGSTPLLDIVAACTSLEELHIKGFMGCTVSPTFVDALIKAAPHLPHTLKVLSVGMNDVEPEALDSLCALKSLERLDFMNCFQSFDYEPSYGYDSDSEDSPERPYDKGLVALANSLPNLKRIDLGYGHDTSHLFGYQLSPNIFAQVRYKLNGRLTIDEVNEPEPWASSEREEAARSQALLEIVEDKNEDETIRSMAEDEIKTRPVCKKRATKKCT